MRNCLSLLYYGFIDQNLLVILVGLLFRLFLAFPVALVVLHVPFHLSVLQDPLDQAAPSTLGFLHFLFLPADLVHL